MKRLIKQYIGGLVCLLALSGCFSSRSPLHERQLHPGMTRDEVLSGGYLRKFYYGREFEILPNGDYEERLIYRIGTVSHTRHIGYDWHVLTFINGKLVKKSARFMPLHNYAPIEENPIFKSKEEKTEEEEKK
ncbi:hypothetical protein [Porphyromonas sp.]|uniref:hypothetical protein n=1 Tax=Porphyromonas sp. TaxID=1924944 RepID=UPI0026DCB29E|nr:hypothetical protein [Porphyromonas sp.]MDO4695533.1 hypothetical protein [Porphyromonas sp.]MDO4771865.1 hypothetical protein [Porphyromonas sp.]